MAQREPGHVLVGVVVGIVVVAVARWGSAIFRHVHKRLVDRRCRKAEEARHEQEIAEQKEQEDQRRAEQKEQEDQRRAEQKEQEDQRRAEQKEQEEGRKAEQLLCRERSRNEYDPPPETYAGQVIAGALVGTGWRWAYETIDGEFVVLGFVIGRGLRARYLVE